MTGSRPCINVGNKTRVIRTGAAKLSCINQSKSSRRRVSEIANHGGPGIVDETVEAAVLLQHFAP